MNRYPITVAGLKRSLPICPVNETLSIGAFVIFGDAPLTQACAAALLEKAPDYDYLLTAEAITHLQTAYGDLNEYLKSRIEAEVRNQKMGVGTLTLSA